MDPSKNAPYYFAPLSEPPSAPFPAPAPELTALDVVTTAEVAVTAIDGALTGEVLPPAPAAVAEPKIEYPIGLIDFNMPIVVIDNDDYNAEEYSNASVVTVLKGSTNPVVVSFWKHGEQCVAQFDTDGDSSCGDYKIEQELAYPVTRFVVVGRDGRSLVVDEELFASEEAALDNTTLEDVAGVFAVVIVAPVKEEPVVTETVSDFHDGGVETEEEDDSQVEGTGAATAQPAAPTEMYVTGRTRRIGDTVYATRGGITRECTITKMRHNATKSLCLHPHDGSPDYWAFNKNVRY